VRRVAPLAVALFVAVVCGGPVAAAASSPEQELADRYAPVVALKQQPEPCSSGGEPYRPVAVDPLFGRSDVRLVDSNGRLIRTAPAAADLYGRSDRTYLDFPGSPLDPGCTYEQWAGRLFAGKPTAAYAHVVTEPGKPGKLALQYWLYYPFNDWNNKHESDWEMIQLMFDASTASEALERSPTEVGYSQHEGAERAAWDDDKLQKRAAHPIVFPGRGSHANYFEQSVWLGHSAQEGFGCDNTTAPSRMVQTQAVLFPDAAPSSAAAPFAWLAYGGHWGQKEHGPNTGPTGPNTKQQWTEPVSWSEDEWRDGSTKVPSGGTIGVSATSFFCGAVAKGSQLYLEFLRTPWFVVGALAAVTLLGVPDRPCALGRPDLPRRLQALSPLPASVHRDRADLRATVDRRHPAPAADDPNHRGRHVPRRDPERSDRQRHLRAALRPALRDLRGDRGQRCRRLRAGQDPRR
jgi:hypothetical protein